MSQLWWSIEVLDGEFSAQRWRESHGPALMEAAITRGAVDWNWEEHHWGVIFEVAFRDAEAWSVFRQLPGVAAALDAVPDPVNGLLIYQGRGGSSNSADPRRPRPHLGAGSAELPREPEPVLVAHLLEVVSGETVERWLVAGSAGVAGR
jgi:hypothetical protein